MSDKDYAPLSSHCVRALNDKLYEKRKNAALEIEKMVKDFHSGNNTAQIKKLLKVLGQDFALSHNPNTRKGGLIGLAAMAIALGKDTSLYVADLVQPVIACMMDQDVRVRYYACETLYNVSKVARGSILPYFTDIFDALSRLAADHDHNVKTASELVDRLMKDIVTESSSFDLVAFIPLLRERIYSKNQFSRQFIVSWVSVLDSVPDIDMLVFLPEILDGLFSILGDPTAEIRKMCESVLGEFLQSITMRPQKVNFRAMVNVLIIHSNSTEELVQFTAITWLREFVRLAGVTLLPYASGILTALLPNLAQDLENRRNIIDTANEVNQSLIQLITQEEEQHPQSERDDPRKGSPDSEEKSNGSSLQVLPEENQLDLESVVLVLTKQIKHDSMQTRIAVLRWIFHLHTKIPEKMGQYMNLVFPVLLQTLSDPADEVVLLDLEVLAEISSSASKLKGADNIPDLTVLGDAPAKLSVSQSRKNDYFSKFMISLLNLFCSNTQLLQDKGAFIIRQLCILLNAEDIYRTLSEILVSHGDAKFARHMVHTLNSILLTSTELFELRNRLRYLETEDSWSLFCCLYRSWCHSPVATVALCLLAQTYEHACELLHLFSEIEVTVDFLTEIDKLVQLIESPIFAYLRLQLLDAPQNPYLIKTLYGLLMLLPQTEAFHTLRHRLACVPNVQLMPPEKPKPTLEKQREIPAFVNFEELLQHFKDTQAKQQRQKKTSRQVGLLSR